MLFVARDYGEVTLWPKCWLEMMDREELKQWAGVRGSFNTKRVCHACHIETTKISQPHSLREIGLLKRLRSNHLPHLADDAHCKVGCVWNANNTLANNHEWN